MSNLGYANAAATLIPNPVAVVMSGKIDFNEIMTKQSVSENDMRTILAACNESYQMSASTVAKIMESSNLSKAEKENIYVGVLPAPEFVALKNAVTEMKVDTTLEPEVAMDLTEARVR
jgi:hypothetical protein